MPTTPFHPREFRQVLGRFATGVTVITFRGAEGDVAGVTINSFASVSLSPPQILFCLDHKARSLKMLRACEHFAVNILSSKQQKLSQAFAQSSLPKPSNKYFAKDVVGCPILRGTLGWLVCKPAKFHNSGDHKIITADVVALRLGRQSAQPLLYFASGYREIAEIWGAG